MYGLQVVKIVLSNVSSCGTLDGHFSVTDGCGSSVTENCFASHSIKFIILCSDGRVNGSLRLRDRVMRKALRVINALKRAQIVVEKLAVRYHLTSDCGHW